MAYEQKKEVNWEEDIISEMVSDIETKRAERDEIRNRDYRPNLKAAGRIIIRDHGFSNKECRELFNKAGEDLSYTDLALDPVQSLASLANNLRAEYQYPYDTIKEIIDFDIRRAFPEKLDKLSKKDYSEKSPIFCEGYLFSTFPVAITDFPFHRTNKSALKDYQVLSLVHQGDKYILADDAYIKANPEEIWGEKEYTVLYPKEVAKGLELPPTPLDLSEKELQLSRIRSVSLAHVAKHIVGEYSIERVTQRMYARAVEKFGKNNVALIPRGAEVETSKHRTTLTSPFDQMLVKGNDQDITVVAYDKKGYRKHIHPEDLTRINGKAFHYEKEAPKKKAVR